MFKAIFDKMVEKLLATLLIVAIFAILYQIGALSFRIMCKEWNDRRVDITGRTEQEQINNLRYYMKQKNRVELPQRGRP